MKLYGKRVNIFFSILLAILVISQIKYNNIYTSSELLELTNQYFRIQHASENTMHCFVKKNLY